MRRDDWLLAQLPVGMLDDDFFVRFVRMFQELATGLLDDADGIDHLLDVSVTPDEVVRWLGSWIGVDDVDPALPVELQRRTVATAAQTLAWRGTSRGLQQFLELLSRGPAQVEDTGGVYPEGTAPATAPHVVLRVAQTGGLTDTEFLALVRDEVPAHVVMEVFVGERRIWPLEVVSSTRALPQSTEVPA
jgi:phage tail-like protein